MCAVVSAAQVLQPPPSIRLDVGVNKTQRSVALFSPAAAPHRSGIKQSEEFLAVGQLMFSSSKRRLYDDGLGVTPSVRCCDFCLSAAVG